MKLLPKKIVPDRIKDAIIQVFFINELPFELLIGYFHRLLSDINYNYISKSNTIRENIANKEITKNHEININLTHLFVNEKHKIKLQIHPNKSISFNTLDNYIGWDNYSIYIEEVLKLLFEHKMIKAVTRTGIRYISEFQNIDILDKVKFSYDSTFIDSALKSSQSNLRWTEDEMDISLNIASRILTPGLINEKKQSIDFISLIDVDVIKKNFNLSNIDEIIDVINKCHEKQKFTFFSLLKDEFLNELNPEY